MNAHLSDSQIEDVFQCFKEEFGLLAPSSKVRPEPELSTFRPLHENVKEELAQRRICEVLNIRGVNALATTCHLKFNPELTVVYGANGSGKSGVSRVLANACFSRGKREILPNLNETLSVESPGAEFITADRAGLNQRTIKYVLGDSISELRRFSFFDGKSIPIHLDDSNAVVLTPAYIQVFDRVSDALKTIEDRIAVEKRLKHVTNPFIAAFQGQKSESAISARCLSLSADTTDEELAECIRFDATSEEPKERSLTDEIQKLVKLDVAATRDSLISDASDIEEFGRLLALSNRILSPETREMLNRESIEINTLIRLASDLGIEQFYDDDFATIGSEKWRAFLSAARQLQEAEKKANNGNQLGRCPLCRQKLGEVETSLFNRYWAFLSSEAEKDLGAKSAAHKNRLDTLQQQVNSLPNCDLGMAAVKVLGKLDLGLVHRLKSKLAEIRELGQQWILIADVYMPLPDTPIPELELASIAAYAAEMRARAAALRDPAPEIAALERERLSIQHRRQASAISTDAVRYLDYLRWCRKVESANLAGTKAQITKRRKDAFLLLLLAEYRETLNKTLKELGCPLRLSMSTSGDQGKTVKEFRFENSDEFQPTQVLSEGEQTVYALADFLTEVELDRSNCGVLFDDPVSSLDHERKEQIAMRLATEAKVRQVIVFTHDPVFVTKLIRSAEGVEAAYSTHWMRAVNGTPGLVEFDTSPKCANATLLKRDSDSCIQGIEVLGAKEQEQKIGIALDYLRAAVEAMIEEYLFAQCVQRYDDHVRVQNLEDAVFDQSLALQLVSLHGAISEMILAHNRSDQMREQAPTLESYKTIRSKFHQIETDLKAARKQAIKDRASRRAAKSKWS